MGISQSYLDVRPGGEILTRAMGHVGGGWDGKMGKQEDDGSGG